MQFEYYAGFDILLCVPYNQKYSFEKVFLYVFQSNKLN